MVTEPITSAPMAGRRGTASKGLSPILDPVGTAVARPPRRRGRVLLWVAIGWLVLVVLLAITADWLPLKRYSIPVGLPRRGLGLHAEFLGTDSFGRSELSRVIFGARESLTVGVICVSVSLCIGTLIGLSAGYFRGLVERLLNILMDTLLAFPPLVLLLAITAVLTQSVRSLIIALSTLGIPAFARLARAHTLSFSQREFVLAARAMGATSRRVLFHEILPNVILPVASYAFVIVAAIMVAEGSLSYLGMGVPPPQPSWGGMIASGQESLSTDPSLVFVPAAILLLTVLAFNIVGDAARARYDVRQSALR